MQIRDLSQPVTSKLLNESMAKNFGYKLKLEQFSDAQLEDVRNKLRTEISQFELEESFDSVHENAQYHKTRALLDVINQAISEREMTSGEKAKEKTLKKKLDPSGMKASMKKQYGKDKGENVYFATIRKRAMQNSVPESWINRAINRMELGESTNKELKAELLVRYDLNESVSSFILMEGEEDKARIIMSTKDMIDSITGWLEDVAAMKAEQLLELQDSIRENLGNDVAEQYMSQVKPSLESIYAALEETRRGLSGGLAVIAGGEMPQMMGAGPEMGGAPAPMPGAEMGAEEMPAEEMPAEEMPPETTPPAPEAGRAKRESVDYSRRLGILLASKKK